MCYLISVCLSGHILGFCFTDHYFTIVTVGLTKSQESLRSKTCEDFLNSIFCEYLYNIVKTFKNSV